MCQLSLRNSVYIIEATIEALGHNTDEIPKSKYCNCPVLNWDGKLLLALDVRKSKEERLPIVILYVNKEQLIDVSKLDNSSGSGKAQAVWNVIVDWNLEDKAHILCYDTTASNTGRINGAFVLLEQKSSREILIFACRYHELVLKAVFKAESSQVTTSFDIPLFKNFRSNWKNINVEKIQSHKETLLRLNDSKIDELLEYYRTELTK
ncbi:hypothetical protein ACJJTC_008768 [Scirpophaga incertulas]